MLIMNRWSYMTPGVIFKTSEYGEKLLLDIGITNNFHWQIFLPILYSEDFAEEPSLSL